MSLLSDLNDYKLVTSFENNPQCVVHTSYRTDRTRGARKITVKEKWVRDPSILGVGTFGIVRLERLESNDAKAQITRRAVKQMHKSHMAKLKIDYKKELIALAKFSKAKFSQAQLFVKFLGWFEDDENVFLAMEYFELGTLDIYITESLTERDVQTISMQLLEGLKIMHEESFTHRDLKPENIFVAQKTPNWWIKIGDFEVSHFIDGDDESSTYTNAVDIWSFACVVYQMMALQVPFPIYPRSLLAFCRGGPFPESPLLQRTSAEGIEFIKSVLVPFPTKRPTAELAGLSSWLKDDDETGASDIVEAFNQVKISDEHRIRPMKTAIINSASTPLPQKEPTANWPDLLYDGISTGSTYTSRPIAQVPSSRKSYSGPKEPDMNHTPTQRTQIQRTPLSTFSGEIHTIPIHNLPPHARSNHGVNTSKNENTGPRVAWDSTSSYRNSWDLQSAAEERFRAKSTLVKNEVEAVRRRAEIERSEKQTSGQDLTKNQKSPTLKYPSEHSTNSFLNRLAFNVGSPEYEFHEELAGNSNSNGASKTTIYPSAPAKYPDFGLFTPPAVSSTRHVAIQPSENPDTVDDLQIGTLVVLVDRAKNLQIPIWIRKPDLYCACRLGNEIRKTENDRRGGKTPVWGQQICFPGYDSLIGHEFKITIFSNDRLNTLIGETWVNLEDVIAPGIRGKDTWHSLSYKGRYAGEIRLEVEYYDNMPKEGTIVGRSRTFAQLS